MFFLVFPLVGNNEGGSGVTCGRVEELLSSKLVIFGDQGSQTPSME